MFNLIFSLLFPYWVCAQYVTASFDTSSIGENPATAATRQFGIITPMASMTEIKQKIHDPYSVGSGIDWDRKIAFRRYELIMAGKGKIFVPEIYVSHNTAAQSFTGTGDSRSESSTNIKLFNNQFNLGIGLADFWKFGFIFFTPQTSYDIKDYFSSLDQERRTTGKASAKIVGRGIGSTLLFGGFAIGAHYAVIDEQSSNSGKTRVNTAAEEPFEYNGKATHQKHGFGMAYQYGDSKKGGFRSEFSFSKMVWGGRNDSGENSNTNNPYKHLNDSQIRLAIEACTLGFTAGLIYTLTTGTYINYRNYLESIFESSNSALDQRVVGSLGGFFGFKSVGGSSVGGYASMYNGESKVKFQGKSSDATISQYSVGVNYAYSF